MTRSAIPSPTNQPINESTNQLPGLDRRGFLQTFLVTAAGVTALPRMAHGAWVEWDPRGQSRLLGDDDAPDLGEFQNELLAEGLSLGDPSMTFGDGKWIAWTEMTDGDHEKIMVRMLDADSADAMQANEGRGTLAYHPTLVAQGSTMRVIVAWVEQSPEANSLLVREFSTNTGLWRGDAEVIREAPGLLRPQLVAVGTGIVAVWEEKIGDRHVIVAKRLGEDAVMTVGEVNGQDCRRPSIAHSPTRGEIAVAFDVTTGEGGHQIHLARLNAESLRSAGSPMQVTHHPASDIAPDVAYSLDGQRLWIAWHSNRGEADTWDIPRWFHLAALNLTTGALQAPASPPRDKDLTKMDTDQGWEFVRVVPCRDGGVWVIGRPSHNWYLQKYHGAQWSPIYRLPADTWGGRGKLASAAIDEDDALWVARRDIRAVALSQVGGADTDDERAPVLVAWSDGEERPLVSTAERYAYPPETTEEGETLNFYFGDIHGHTYMSDGMGDVDEYFLRCRDLHGDDFCALTDHDNFVGQRFLSSEYEEHKRAVEHYHDPGRFATIYAQEWTTPRANVPLGFGHINLYSTTPDHPMMDHLDPQERWNTQASMSAACREHGMIGGPHHVAWTGYKWEEHEPEAMRFVEMCSVHGVFEYEGNEPIPHRGNFPGSFVQDGLARGLKFGFVGGSDQHGLIWHHQVCWKRNAYRAGLTGVLAPELTREAIFEALRNRRTFATTGVKVRMGFKVNGALMGSVIESDGPPQLHFDFISPTDIRWVDIVRSNQTILRRGGESPHTFFSHTDTDCPIGEEVWYYVRVILSDDNMAWSSPIWVTRRGEGAADQAPAATGPY